MELLTNIPDIIKRLEQVKGSLGGNGGSGNPPSLDFSDAMFGAINTGVGLMKRRIFNNSEDAEGGSLGDYHGDKTKVTTKKYSIVEYEEAGLTVRVNEDGEGERKKKRANIKKAIKDDVDAQYTEYEKYRLGRGRQIEKKDLELEGSLRRSIQPAKNEDGRVVVAIVNEDDAKKARYQEQQIGNIRAGQHANKGTATPAVIFVFSQAEYDYVKTEGNRLIRAVIKQKFDQP